MFKPKILKKIQNLEFVEKIEAGDEKRWPRSCRLNSWLRILLAAELATQLAGEQIAFYHGHVHYSTVELSNLIKIYKNCKHWQFGALVQPPAHHTHFGRTIGTATFSFS
jgi:hypothetical protein